MPGAVISGLKSAAGVGGNVVGMGDPETTDKNHYYIWAVTSKV